VRVLVVQAGDELHPRHVTHFEQAVELSGAHVAGGGVGVGEAVSEVSCGMGQAFHGLL
jgi:hypothetical protein